MATTAVAYGKIRNRMNEGQPMPAGWGLDSGGRATTDPLDVTRRGGFMAPLGGSRESGSYKGYGLSVMVNILTQLPRRLDPDHRPDAHEEAAGL